MYGGTGLKLPFWHCGLAFQQTHYCPSSTTNDIFDHLLRLSLPWKDFRGQLYMVAKSSQDETGKEAGEGIEIVKNHPYEVNDPVNKHNMPKGQYTYVSTVTVPRALKPSYHVSN